MAEVEKTGTAGGGTTALSIIGTVLGALGTAGVLGEGLNVGNVKTAIAQKDLDYVKELASKGDEIAALKSELLTTNMVGATNAQVASLAAQVTCLTKEIEQTRREAQHYTDTRVNNESALTAMALKYKMDGIINGIPSNHVYTPETAATV